MRGAVALLALVACSSAEPGPTPDPGAADASTVNVEPARTASEPDPGPAPCERLEVAVVDGGRAVALPVPCRPFDPLRDGPRPAP